MKKIEIITTQNVTIEYELASLFERIGAFLLDFFFIWSSIGILNLISAIFSFNSDIFFFVTAIPIFFFYSLAFEILNNGQSLGKYLLKLKVVKLTNEKADFFDYIMRWTFRMIDIYFSLGTLAATLVYSSSNGQRLGDLLADTSVIKVLNKNRYMLQNVLKKNDVTDYEPKYPEVVSYTEKDMLLIKECLDRYVEHPTQGHKEALILLLNKIEAQLNIKIPKNAVEFLRTLIKDYVYLTR
ncbi:MAG: RDD family protein [Bacteroidetes bacterium]|nr:RDD family protein [Bacteroidota bacterium]